MVLRVDDAVRSAVVNVIRDAIDAGAGPGLLRIYAGAKPGTKGAAPAGLLLAELTLADPCGVTTTGVLNFTVPFSDTSANNSGTAAFFYLCTSTGAYVCEGDIGTSGSDLNLVTTSIVAGQPVQVTSFSFTAAGA